MQLLFFVLFHHSRAMISAAFAPTRKAGIIVFPDVISGSTEMSITRSRARPWKLRCHNSTLFSFSHLDSQRGVDHAADGAGGHRMPGVRARLVDVGSNLLVGGVCNKVSTKTKPHPVFLLLLRRARLLGSSSLICEARGSLWRARSCSRPAWTSRARSSGASSSPRSILGAWRGSADASVTDPRERG